MISPQIMQKAMFRLRDWGRRPISLLCRCYWLLQGARLGHGTELPPRLQITWPHQVSIGRDCHLEDDVFFKFDGIWVAGPSIVIKDNVFIGRGCEFNIRVGIVIEDDCLVASGCKFIDHDHGTDHGTKMRSQPGPESSIHIANNVWLGVNVTVLKGVGIGTGAVIAAGAVVTKSVPPNEIWGGVPARCIGLRSAVSQNEVSLMKTVLVSV